MTFSETKATCFLASSGSRLTSMPLMKQVPVVGGMKFRNRLMVVVLPAPLAPSRQ
jgi:hypothetical protein